MMLNTYLTKAVMLLLLLAMLTACNKKTTTEAPQKSDLRLAYERPPEQWPAPTLDSGVVHHELGILKKTQLVPRDTGGTYEEIIDENALASLGKQLFFDPILSASNQVSCGSCHDPDLGWGDGRRRSFGHDRERGLRNAPSLLNAGHWTSLFWDGRAGSLEEQALGPLQDTSEMNETLATLGAELSTYPGYQEAFAAAFGVANIDAERVTIALAAFERTLRSRTSRFDQFVKGNYAALSEQDLRGLDLFRTKARCMNCHNGPLFSDQKFHNQGSHLYGRTGEDLGLYALTGKWEDAGKFRTPMLRDITFTGPYFHHGNIAELREIMQMYNSGMPQVIPRNVLNEVDRIPVHDRLLQPLKLTEAEIDDLLAFMGAISTRPQAVRIPEPLSQLNK